MRRRACREGLLPLLVAAVLAGDPETCDPASEEACDVTQPSVVQRFQRLVDEGNALVRSAGGKADVLESALLKYSAALDLDNSSASAAGPLTNMGIALRQLGRRDEALDKLRRGVALDPGSFYAQYSIGNILADVHDWAGADLHFSAALNLSAPAFEAGVRTNWANLLQRSVHYGDVAETEFAGRDVVKEAYKLMLPILKALNNKNQRPDGTVVGILGQILYKRGKHEMRDGLHKLAVKRGIWQDTRQRPTNFDLKFAKRKLSAPWWTGSTLPLPFLSEVGSHWRELRGELDGLLARDQLTALGGDELELIYTSKGHDWRQMSVIKAGQLEPDAAARTPVAARVFQKTPLLGDQLNFVRFSVLFPGTTAEPHCGQTNVRVMCHLPLRVPEGGPESVGIAVAGEARSWVEGQWLCFDDSFEHRVWNDTPEPRGILTVQFRHPLY